MADLTFYNLSMTGEEADSGIRVGMDIGALNGIPYSNGNNEILTAIPGEDYGYPLLRGYGPPTADTAASFGQHYYDLSATKPPFEWICIAFTETGGFMWRQHNDAGYFQATYGTTTYQDVIQNYNLGKVCIVVDSNNDIFYLGTVDTNLLTFYRALHNVSSAQDGARFEFENVRVTSTNTWSRFFHYAENSANRTQVINEQSTDIQYPTAKAVYTYGQSIDTAAQGYAEAAEEAAKEYTDEQLEPVASSASKAETYALGAYVTPTAAGDIASFDDGADGIPVKSLVVDIEPVQNLNGYDSPWPPGGGKNLFPLEINIDDAEYVHYYTLSEYPELKTLIDFLQNNIGKTLTYSAETTGTPHSGAVTVGTLSIDASGVVYGLSPGDSRAIPDADYSTVTRIAIYGSSTGGTVKNAQLELGSIATAYSPYSNICPISGWTGAKVQRTGKNLIDVPEYENVSSAVIRGENASKFAAIEFKENTQYTLSGVVSSSNETDSWGINVKYTDGTSAYLWLLARGAKVPSVTTARGKTVKTMNFAFARGFILSIANTQLEEGPTVTDYEPYRGNTYDISFPDEAGTVYGGALDVTSGVLTVDKAKILLNSLSYSMAESTATNARFISSIPGIKAPTDIRTTVNAICATYPAGPWSWLDEPGHNIFFAARQRDNSMQFIIRNAAYATTEEFSASLSDADVLVYELATPLTCQLTATEVTTLLGVNNVYSDTGDTEVTYRADPTLIYNKLAAAIISSGGTV